LSEKIDTALDLYPCDLLFVHRDAENAPLDSRQAEIYTALDEARSTRTLPPGIAIVPIRMTEAWLLIDACAIREAAGNPNGSIPLSLPNLRDVEGIADPKSVLHNLILEATELPTRRKKNFSAHNAALRITEYIEDFSTLRRLAAFSALEQQLVETIGQQRWGEASAR
jgi:hypothetical protein